MTNKYEDAEKIGRDLTLKIFGDKIQLTELSQKSRADFSGSTINGDFILEAKYRNFSSTDYNDDIFEVSKCEGMKNISQGKMNMFYLMIFNDGVARLHHINRLKLIDLNFGIKDCLISSMHPELGTESKMIIYLPKDKAKKYTY
ncbi:MAG: hypothetical protein EOO47_00105 [Flavobacterium sp.]|nr:MAG: hypothetical protein EOO47_00105 [Flavobacterium sp.]